MGTLKRDDLKSGKLKQATILLSCTSISSGKNRRVKRVRQCLHARLRGLFAALPSEEEEEDEFCGSLI